MGKCFSRNLSEELHKAVMLRKHLTCRMLIILGADINAKDENGNTPLLVMASEARKDQDVAMIKMLAEHGANLEATDSSGDTPLLLLLARWSCMHHPKTVKCLCEHGANVNVRKRNRNGMTPAMILAREGCTNILKIIIEHGADLNAKTTDISKETALFFAVQHDGYDAKTDIVQMLCENGADVNASDCKGRTPLDFARWNLDLVKILINNGLNLSLQNEQGGKGTIRIDVNEDELIKYLRSFGTLNGNYEIFQSNKRVAELWREYVFSKDYVWILLCEKGSVLKFIDYDLNKPFTCMPLMLDRKLKKTVKLLQISGVNTAEWDEDQNPILWTELDSLEEVIKFREEHKPTAETRSRRYTEEVVKFRDEHEAGEARSRRYTA